MIGKIKSLILSKSSLFYLISEEEERVERLLIAAAQKLNKNSPKVYGWSCLRGLTLGNEQIVSDGDPVVGLDHFLKMQSNSILIFKDLHLLIKDNSKLIRQVKECSRVARATGKKIFL